MTGKVFIHATMSLDGFIADTAGTLDWAFRFPGPSAAAIREIIASIGAVVAGRRGYDLGMMRGDQKVYGGAWSGPQFVLTHRRAQQVEAAVRPGFVVDPGQNGVPQVADQPGACIPVASYTGWMSGPTG